MTRYTIVVALEDGTEKLYHYSQRWRALSFGRALTSFPRVVSVSVRDLDNEVDLYDSASGFDAGDGKDCV